MIGIIGKKIGMTSVFDENGNNIPCTVVEAGPCVVSQVKNKEGKDGYNAIQLAYEEKSEKRSSKAIVGHFKKAGTTPKKKVAEFSNFRGAEMDKKIKLGDEIRVDIFLEGEWVDVSGISKGKGFQGVVKRHGFRGVGGQTHGQHNRERAPGSLGASSYPSRVFKGMRMAGQTGGRKIKVTNLKVIKIIPKENLLILKGAVPGSKNSYLIIEK